MDYFYMSKYLFGIGGCILSSFDLFYSFVEVICYRNRRKNYKCYIEKKWEKICKYCTSSQACYHSYGRNLMYYQF